MSSYNYAWSINDDKFSYVTKLTKLFRKTIWGWLSVPIPWVPIDRKEVFVWLVKPDIPGYHQSDWAQYMYTLVVFCVLWLYMTIYCNLYGSSPITPNIWLLIPVPPRVLRRSTVLLRRKFPSTSLPLKEGLKVGLWVSHVDETNLIAILRAKVTVVQERSWCNGDVI